MARKRQKNILLIILGIVIGLYLLNYFGVFDFGLPGLSIVPIVLDEGTQTISPYYCPQEADFCTVTGTMFCNAEKTNQEPKVVIRTFGDMDDLCVGYDFDNDGLLEGRQTAARLSCPSFFGALERKDGIKFINIDGLIWVDVEAKGRDCLSTKSSTTTPTYRDCAVNPSIQPQSGCFAPELCIGEPNRYECSAVLKVNDILQSESLYYFSSSSEGSRTSSQYTLNPGDKFEIIGGDSIKIEYSAFRNEERCYSDYCQGNGYVPCVDELGNPIQSGEVGYPDLDNFQSCVYGCDNGKCLDPYRVKVSIKDKNGFERTSFAKGDDVKLYVTIETPSPIEGDLTLELRESTIQGTPRFTESRTFKANEQMIFTTSFDYTDTFYIVLSIDYPVLQEPDIYGINEGEFTSFNVVDQFTANLRFTQTIGGVDVSNEFYTGYPIKIEYIFQEPGQTPILPDSAVVTSNGNPLILSNQFTDDESGYFIYYLLTETPGLYDISATATKGLYTTPESRQQIQIERDQVVLDYDISHNPVQNNQPYTNILTWTTKNRNKEKIETSNTVEVLINGVKSGTIPVKGSAGQYSIDYTFTVENADYSFIINSVPSGNLVPAEKQTILIKSGSDDEEFCNSDDDCGFLGVCNQGNCETNTTTVFALVGGGFLLVIIIIIFLRFRKKRQEPNFGGLGL